MFRSSCLTWPPPSSVTRFPPSITVSRVIDLVELRMSRYGAGPQLKVTTPPAAMAPSKALSVQLAGVPSPTTLALPNVITTLMGIAHEEVPGVVGGVGATGVVGGVGAAGVCWGSGCERSRWGSGWDRSRWGSGRNRSRWGSGRDRSLLGEWARPELGEWARPESLGAATGVVGGVGATGVVGGVGATGVVGGVGAKRECWGSGRDRSCWGSGRDRSRTGRCRCLIRICAFSTGADCRDDVVIVVPFVTVVSV